MDTTDASLAPSLVSTTRDRRLLQKESDHYRGILPARPEPESPRQDAY